MSAFDIWLMRVLGILAVFTLLAKLAGYVPAALFLLAVFS